MVHERRRELGLTQAEVAERAGITQPPPSRIEGSGSEPTPAMLDRIAKAMHTTFTITVGDHAANGHGLALPGTGIKKHVDGTFWWKSHPPIPIGRARACSGSPAA
ncbi:hypothetical protein GCM10010191_01860 [Actinomadura vinacea]|uniref:HTH cro/C1-type domain-containing protein n=1 Tax=Actinomadura vinacea TaxID=115336 RepID=A0ABN3IA05_9ACTN